MPNDRDFTIERQNSSAGTARIKPVRSPSPKVAEILAKTAVGNEHGAPLDVFSTLAHHPRLLKRFNVLGGLFMTNGELVPRQRELVILRTAWLSKCEYEWGQHVLIGSRCGITEQEIAELVKPLEKNMWTSAEFEVLQFADEIFETLEIADERWASITEHLSNKQILELTALVGFYRMLAGILNAVRVQREDYLPGWPPTGQF